MRIEQPERLKKSIMLFVRGGVTLLVALIFAFVWLGAYQNDIILPFYRKGNWLFILLYLLLYHIFTRFYGGYRIGTERLTDVIYTNWLALALVNCITYIQISLIAHGFQDLVPIFAMTFAQAAMIFIWSVFINRFYFKLFRPLKLVCLYSGEYPKWLVERFDERPEKFEITESVSLSRDNCRYIGKIDESDGVLMYNLNEAASADMLKYCVEHKKRYYIIPSIANILLRTSKIIYLFDIPILMAKNDGLSPEQRLVKRVVDIIVSGTAIAVALIPMMITAAAIKFNDGGSVLYTQDRCTKDGKVFKIFKFRSMKENAEADGVARLAADDDPRITPVGRVIRKYRLDELPQLFNILHGEMSVVGPRPERPEIIEKYKQTVPEFDQRLNVKCGLTGYAQVMGNYSTLPEEKLKLDLIYIQKYSILMDFKIMLMTVKIIVMNENKAK